MLRSEGARGGRGVTAAARSLPALAVAGGRGARSLRALPEEVPVALVYDGSTQAVMMASPADLEDFALGFSLTEGIVRTADEIDRLSVERHAQGIELNIWLAGGAADALARRRRRIAGPVGCGLCGIESLAEALRPVPEVPTSTLVLTPSEVTAAAAELAGAQPLHDLTRAVHGAALWRPEAGVVLAREDVGRHNALDKLVGAAARAGVDARGAAVVLSSRVSVEMVQKAAVLGAPVIIAASAPTALAVETAARAGIALVALARGDRFEVFTHPHRIAAGAAADVA
jgi:FdhD protein